MYQRERRFWSGRLPVWTAALLSVTAQIHLTHAQDAAAAKRQGAKPQAPRKAWEPVGHFQHAAIAECSGIVASRQYPGIFWVHNDSGNPAFLYAVKESGELVAEVPVAGANNFDWEDIAADDQGNLYIADTGNNFGVFPMRSVYRVKEPDPFASPVVPAKVTRQYDYTFPGKRFDVEALYVGNGGMWLVSKPRDGSLSVLYRLDPTEKSKYQPIETAQLTFRGVSGADLSPDGKRLAICTPWMLYVLAVDEQGVLVPDAPQQQIRHPGGSYEACCFDGDDVVLASEDGDICRISATDLAAGVRFVDPKRLQKDPRQARQPVP